MCHTIKPLAAPLWFQRIAVIASGELGTVENSLRHAAHLTQLVPNAFRRVISPVLDEDAFEALLESGELDVAARQLFVPPTTLLIEARADGQPQRAVVGCPILKRPVDGRGETVAGAILAAWANWLITLRLEYGSDLDDDPVPASRPQMAACEGVCLRAV